MLSHGEWSRGDLSILWHLYRGPLIAFGVALAFALLARLRRGGFIGAAAGGAGVLAGWFVLTGWSAMPGSLMSGSLLSGGLGTLAPPQPLDRLPAFAAVALVIGLATAGWNRARAAPVGLLLIAVFAVWWLGGAARHVAELWAFWPIGLGVVVMMVLFGWQLSSAGFVPGAAFSRTEAFSPCRGVLAGLTLAAALHVVQAPPAWALFALVPAAASLALALARGAGTAGLVLAADYAALASVIVIAGGRLPRHGVGPVDVAAISPLVALLLASVLVPRFGSSGRLATLLSYVLAGAIAVAMAWAAVRGLSR